ncbi:MAG: LysR family transcriptional regulator [Clostridia bacterium]
MDFRELVYITTVAEYKSITKAATALYISQPSLSHFILKVEEEMGVRLFDRTTSPISLTYAGEKYIEVARQILMLHANLKREFRDIAQGKKGRINIGIPHERACYMLPLVLPQYRKKYPGIEVNVYEARTKVLIESVIKGQTDFIILPFHINDKSLSIEPIYEEEIVLVAKHDVIRKSGCVINEKNQIDMATVQNVPFILLKNGHGIRRAVDILFENFKINPNVILEISSNQTACRLAAAGMGVAIVPEMTVRLLANVKNENIYSLTNNPITWEIVAAYRKDAYIGLAEKDFFEMARKVFFKCT